jgi:DNA-binding transcriptional MerR regulator
MKISTLADELGVQIQRLRRWIDEHFILGDPDSLPRGPEFPDRRNQGREVIRLTEEQVRRVKRFYRFLRWFDLDIGEVKKWLNEIESKGPREALRMLREREQQLFDEKETLEEELAELQSEMESLQREIDDHSF